LALPLLLLLALIPPSPLDDEALEVVDVCEPSPEQLGKSVIAARIDREAEDAIVRRVFMDAHGPRSALVVKGRMARAVNQCPSHESMRALTVRLTSRFAGVTDVFVAVEDDERIGEKNMGWPYRFFRIRSVCSGSPRTAALSATMN
jgi:hypothetical protein